MTNRIPPQQLLDYRLDVRKAGTIGEGGEPVVSNNAIDLFLSLALNLRIQLHGEEERFKERNGGISTTGVERSSRPFDVRFRLGIEVLSAQEFRSVRRDGGAGGLRDGSVNLSAP